MLCGLGAAVFGVFVRTWSEWTALGAGMVAALWLWSPANLPDPVWVGILVALFATGAILRQSIRHGSAFAAGLLAGILGSLLHSEGMTAGLSVPVALAVPIVAAMLARRNRRFAPEAIREEAMLLMLFLGVGVAAAPVIAAGWSSAAALNLPDNGQSIPAIPGWVLAVAGASLGTGGLFALGRRG